MSKRRLTFVAALVAAVLTSGPLGAQEPRLDEVLKRAAAYVANFRRQLSGIVAEETYRQEVVNNARIADAFRINPQRTLKSDLLLVKAAEADRYVELRDVFEVDGKAVRDRQARVEQLLTEGSLSATSRIGAIIQESARYNIGRVQRNINTPLLSLSFLDDSNRDRFTFRRIVKPTPVFRDPQDKSINDAPLFRVATEMWEIGFEETARDTFVKAPNGDRRPSRGRFWIDPSNGSVLISELIIDGGGVIATVTVSYQSEPLMGFLVPVEMRESYVRYPERITGHARYSRFRPIQ